MAFSQWLRSERSELGWIALVATAHFMAASGIGHLGLLAGGFSGVWIANAVSTALIARRAKVPDDVWIAIAVAGLAANAVIGLPAVDSVIYVAASLGQIALATRFTRNVWAWAKSAPEPTEFLRTMVGGGALAPLLAATAVSLASMVTGVASPLPLLVTWFLGNALGFVLVFPVATLASFEGIDALRREGRLATLAFTVLSCAAIVAVAVGLMKAPFLLVLLPLLAAAVYMQPLEVSILSAATGTSFMGMAVLNGLSGGGMTAFKAGFQVPLALTLSLPMLACILMEELRRRERVLSESEERAQRAAQEVAEAQKRWNYALESAGQGVWDADLVTGETFYSDTWRAMLGYEVGDVGATSEDWLMLLHPDDRDRVRTIDDTHVAGKADRFEAEYRIRRKDGSYIWVLDRGRALARDAEGRCLRAIGTYTDITRHKLAEARIAESAAELRREKERLRVTLRSIGDAVICTDGEDRVTFMNPVAEALTGHRFGRDDRLELDAVYAPVDEDTGERIDRYAKQAARMTCGHTGRAVLVGRDGVRRSIREVVTPIVSDTAEPAGRVIVFQDYTDARSMQRELAYAATHDALTGLLNRGAFLAAMANAVHRPQSGDEASQLLYIDLDRFKLVNDSSGHGAGDALLRQVAQAVMGAVRKGDVVARLGGDEFAILLDKADDIDAHGIATAVCAAIAAVEFAWEGLVHRVGASVGIARIDRMAEVDDIIVSADRACYLAKAAGRGAVIRASRSAIDDAGASVAA